MGPEAKIQSAVVKYAREKYKGKLVAKKNQATMMGSNGYPDYEFFIKGGRLNLIEFKAPGAECTELQLRRHAELRALGFVVVVCDNASAGKATIDSWMRPARVFRLQNRVVAL
jgi:hypothetical protein